MNKIIGKYTFSEAVEKVIEERKRLAWMNPSDKLPDDFKLPDPAECLIEEVENEKKLFDKFNKLKTEHEEQGETLCKTRKKLAKKDKKCHKLSKENKKLNKQITTLTTKNKKLSDAESNKQVLKLTKENEILTNEKEELTRQITTLTTKNKNLNKKCKQLKKEKELKLSLSHNQDTTLSNTFISSLSASYEKSEKEKEEIHKKLQESNIQKDAFADKVATQEEEIKRLKSYINSLETKLYLKNNLGDN